jgi:hypothetical protein
MNWEEIKSLKFFALYCLLLVSFFAYSSITGWKWFNPTKTEPSRPTGRVGHVYRYHK